MRPDQGHDSALLAVSAGGPRFAVGDTTTWLRSGFDARFTTSRNTAIVLEGSGNRMYGENWFEGVVHLQLHF